jgi:GNAT superfamily N-acetyltransferase
VPAVTTLRLRVFTDDDVVPAGRLLALRHAAHRRREPLLDPRFEDPAVAADAVRAAWLKDGASGAVAVRGGETVGYLVGAPKADPVWGDNVWVDSAGHAVAPGDAEVARDLYGSAAQRWVDEGRTAHYVLVPAGGDGGPAAGGADALVDAWFRLAFGLQHVHAVREPVPAAPAPRPPLVVRPAERADVPVLGAIDVALPAHQARSPVLSGAAVPTVEEQTTDWEDTFGDPRFPTWVAEVPGPDGAPQVVGAAVGCALTQSRTHEGLALLPDAGFLGFAAVLPGARGLGAGRALGEQVLAWSGEAGYACCVTDWRATNLLSSRAWPRLGFRDTFWRLHRTVGH